MNLLISFLQKTIGQKIMVGLTGLGLCVFVLVHMLGNLFILSGAEAYNNYADKLHHLPGFKILELGLLVFFLAHILLSLLLQIKNRKARGPNPYQKSSQGLKKTSLLHHWLWIQGALLFVFVVFHLISFKFGDHQEIIKDGKAKEDVYSMVVEAFQQPSQLFGYSFILLILSVHLLRGFSASFKSLGVSHPTVISWIETFSWIFTLIVTLGFLIPIWYIYLWL